MVAMTAMTMFGLVVVTGDGHNLLGDTLRDFFALLLLYPLADLFGNLGGDLEGDKIAFLFGHLLAALPGNLLGHLAAPVS